MGKGLRLGPPKSRAGLRVVSIPSTVVEAVRTHLAEFPDMGNLVFTVPSGAPIRRGNLNQLLKWHTTVNGLGLDGVHVHDLRHTGNTLAAASGVSTRDLMSRMGHDSMQAPLGYQHATAAADARIAAVLEKALTPADEDDDRADDDGEDGAAGVPVPAR